MKNFAFIAMVCAMAFTACQKADLSEIVKNDTQKELKKNFVFHVKGDFFTDYEEMGTRASVRLEENNSAGVTDLWVLDYDSLGVLQQQAHQSSTDTDFGHPSMSLTYGHHDIKFIASKGTTPVLTASALSWTKVLDTFTLSYPVDVIASSNGNRAPELTRAITGVKVQASDVVPGNVGTIEMTMNRSLSITIPSLTASSATASTNTFTISESQWNKSGLALTTYTLCPADEMTTDVTVVVKSTAGVVLSEFTVTGVALKKNRITTLTGEVFGRGSGFSVVINDGWDEGLNVNF